MSLTIWTNAKFSESDTRLLADLCGEIAHFLLKPSSERDDCSQCHDGKKSPRPEKGDEHRAIEKNGDRVEERFKQEGKNGCGIAVARSDIDVFTGGQARAIFRSQMEKTLVHLVSQEPGHGPCEFETVTQKVRSDDGQQQKANCGKQCHALTAFDPAEEPRVRG